MNDAVGSYLQESVPNEVVLMIFPHLDRGSLLSVGSTCSKLHDLSSEESLWRKRAKIDFSKHESQKVPKKGKTWKQVYFQCHLAKVRLFEDGALSILAKSSKFSANVLYNTALSMRLRRELMKTQQGNKEGKQILY